MSSSSSSWKTSTLNQYCVENSKQAKHVYCTCINKLPPPHISPQMQIWIEDYILRLSHTRNSNLIYFQTFFRDLNKDPSVHGIIVQMPLDSEQEVKTRFGNDLKKNNFSAKMIILKQSNDNSEQSMTSFQKLL